MADLRRSSRTALGEHHRDDLDARVEKFLVTPPEPQAGPTWPFQALSAVAPQPATAPEPAPAPARGGMGRLAFGWFPADQFAEAKVRWPELADAWGAQMHAAYSRDLQHHLVELWPRTTRGRWGSRRSGSTPTWTGVTVVATTRPPPPPAPATPPTRTAPVPT